MECRKCKEVKEIEDFAKGRRVCKKCASLKSMEWSKNNKEKVLKNAKKFRENNRELCRKRCLDLYHKQPFKNKEYRELNREKLNEKKREWIKNNPEKRKCYIKNNLEKHGNKYYSSFETSVRKKVYKAVRSGVLVRPDNCSICKSSNVGKIEAHHNDYNKPLDVIWVCKSCHGTIHIELRRREKGIYGANS